MDSNKIFDIEKVLEILDEQVLQNAGRHLNQAERAVIRGSWDSKEYKEIAKDFGYSVYYLQQEVGPPLWTMLSKVLGNGIQVKKITLRNILMKVAKEYYVNLEASKLDNDCLVGRTRIYGELPKIAFFYGREKDISHLKKQINTFKKRCIAITGVGGVGKSLVAAKLVEKILLEHSNVYEYVVWKKIERYSSIDSVVNDLINIFDLKFDKETLQQKISLLLQELCLHRCLLVIDGFEKLIQVKNYEEKLEYEDFLIGLTKEAHQSCLIITSQVPLEEVACITTDLPVVSLRLEGLEEDAAIQMLHEKGLSGEQCKNIIEIYRRNPSALEAVADRINRFFGGSVQRFFEYRTTLIEPRIQVMLNRQFGTPGFLSNLQREIMIYLAESTSDNGITIPFFKLIDDLKERYSLELSISEVITAMDILEQRSLVESSRKSTKQEVSYSLQPVVKKYILVDPLGLVHKRLDRIQTREIAL
ncbi:MAG: ATP-binding protein [Mojavia pulchra JT2-VF2]|jgi:hypothetical protein|uniref:ATP-binding protein n=1 Tax=Mojavia pulchra JT2-VF2 TaxID=287848 RepID=A0A951Q8G9_9NOST|nr:ATP-binding protein [Mojavia pulchra JT2-VF2]